MRPTRAQAAMAQMLLPTPEMFITHLGILMVMSSTGTPPAQILAELLRLLPKWQQEAAKAEFLDELYVLYDHGNAPLGVRGTYTGLWQRYQRDLACITRLSAYFLDT